MAIAAMEMPADDRVLVHTTQNRGFTPEEVAERCVRDQALAFKAQIERLVAAYMREAIQSDRTTVYNALKDAAHPELAELIRRL